MNLQRNFSLQHYNTFGFAVETNYFTEVFSIEELKETLNFAKENQLEILFLGGGSNVLFTKNFNGIVIKISLLGKKIVSESQNTAIVEAQAGENWHEFVLFCIENNLGGLENLSLIPGNVGTAPMQNIGAYGVEIKDTFHSLQAMNIETLQTEIFTLQDCEFGYRESIFKRKFKGKYVILSVQFYLQKFPHIIHISYGAIREILQANDIENPTIKDVSNAVISIRESKLPNPKEIGNAGSFFKNPVVVRSILEKIQEEYPEIPFYEIDENTVKIPAGWLIERLGYKGKKQGNVGVHAKQALVLVHYGNGKGKEIFTLSQQIIDEIQKEFNIILEREVNIV